MSIKQLLIRESQDSRFTFQGYHSSNIKNLDQGEYEPGYQDSDFERVVEVYYYSVPNTREDFIPEGNIVDIINSFEYEEEGREELIALMLEQIEDEGIGVTYVSERPISDNITGGKWKYGDHIYKVYVDESKIKGMITDPIEIDATMIVYDDPKAIKFKKYEVE